MEPRRRLIFVSGGVLVAVMSFLVPLQAQNSGYVRRFLANKLDSDAEIATTILPAPGGAGGMVFYNKNFFTANDIDTIYVTISAAGDDHNGARLMLSCSLDGNPCDPSSHENAGGAPSGWFTAMRHKNYNNNYAGFFGGDGGGGGGDLHDNIVHYTWCTPFNGPAGSHNVQLKLASSPGPGDPGASFLDVVFLEAVYVFVDGSRVANPNASCPVKTPGVDPTVAVTPSTTTAPDGSLIDTTIFVPLTAPSTLTVPQTPQVSIP